MNGKAKNQAGWAKAKVIRHFACFVIYFLMLSITFAKNSGDANNPCKIANAADVNIKANITLSPQSAALVAYYKLDDNEANWTIIDEQGFSNGTLSPHRSANRHIAGVLNGAIDFTKNNYPSAHIYVNLNNSFKDILSADYSIAYLCKSSDFRGSIIAVDNSLYGNSRTMIDIATLFHQQRYFTGETIHHTGIIASAVPARFNDRWALFTHRVSQKGTGVRIRLGINGRDYVDKLGEDFLLAAYNDNPGFYGDAFLAAYNDTYNGTNGAPVEGFKCSLDEVRIYSGVLTDAEIKALCALYGLTYEGGDYMPANNRLQ